MSVCRMATCRGHYFIPLHPFEEPYSRTSKTQFWSQDAARATQWDGPKIRSLPTHNGRTSHTQRRNPYGLRYNRRGLDIQTTCGVPSLVPTPLHAARDPPAVSPTHMCVMGGSGIMVCQSCAIKRTSGAMAQQ